MTNRVDPSLVIVGSDEQTNKAWGDNPRAAFVVRALVVLVPLAVAFVATWQIAQEWQPPDTAIMAILRFIVLALVATVVAAATDRVARRMLPLAALLRLSLVFPDEAPSRFAVALRSNNTKKLEKRLAELQSGGFTGSETEAAHLIVELAASLSKHDRLTRGHSERVRAFSALIGEEIGLSPEDNNKLQWAALIHDVGKLNIPYEILTKPGKLTEREFAIIKTHPAEGMRIAAPLAQFLGPWIHAVGQHHERFDGGGYPQGLVGGQISLGGRIVAVADAYDVMTAARSYKPAHSAKWAREELARCAGSQFDPEVVRAFLNVGLGQVRRTMWPLSWALQLPFIGSAVTAPIAQTVAASVVTLATATGVAAVDGGFDAVVDAPVAVAFVDTAPNNVDAGFGTASSTVPAASSTTEPQSRVGDAAATSTIPTTTTTGDASTSTSTSTSLAPTTTSTTTDAPTTTTTVATSTTVTTVLVDTTTTVTTVPIETTTTTVTTVPIAPDADCDRAQAGDVDLDGAALVGCDLSGFDFVGASLQGADLTGANLTGAVLDEAVLIGASLDFATLDGVSAVGTSFANANLDNAVIVAGVFTEANFANAHLNSAQLVGTTFAGADFSGAELYGASIEQADFAGAYLADALLKGATVSITDFGGIIAPRMWAKNSTFYAVSFDGAELTNARFMNTTIEWSSFVDADLSLADFTGAQLIDMNFSYSTLDDTAFKNATILRTSFDQATAEPESVSFEGAELRDGSMVGVRFPNGRFRDATIENWNFDQAFLHGSSFRGTSNEELTFSGADVKESDWRWANLSAVNLAGGWFTGATFEGADGVPNGHQDAFLDGVICPGGDEAQGSPPDCW